MKSVIKLIGVAAFSLMLGLALQAAEPVYPAYSGFVNDYAGVIDQATKTKLEGLCRQLEAKTSAELAIAVVKTVAPLDPKTYAVKLFEKWKIGKKGKDNGLLVLLAMDERRVEIEVGYGLEGTINDAKAGAVLDQFGVPFFKQGEFGAGLYNTAAALSEEIVKASGQELGEEYQPVRQAGGADWQGNDTLISIAVLTIAVFSVFFNGLMAGIVGGIIGAVFGFFLWGAGGSVLGAILGFVVSYLRFFRGGWGGWAGGMFSGGDFGGGGGGFGGFGGGGSGGGGSGRSW